MREAWQLGRPDRDVEGIRQEGDSADLVVGDKHDDRRRGQRMSSNVSSPHWRTRRPSAERVDSASSTTPPAASDRESRRAPRPERRRASIPTAPLHAGRARCPRASRRRPSARGRTSELRACSMSRAMVPAWRSPRAGRTDVRTPPVADEFLRLPEHPRRRRAWRSTWPPSALDRGDLFAVRAERGHHRRTRLRAGVAAYAAAIPTLPELTGHDATHARPASGSRSLLARCPGTCTRLHAAGTRPSP